MERIKKGKELSKFFCRLKEKRWKNVMTLQERKMKRKNLMKEE